MVLQVSKVELEQLEQMASKDSKVELEQ